MSGVVTKSCTRCGESKPATRAFFGSTPSGGLKGFCRTCMNKASAQYEANNPQARLQRDAKRAGLSGGTRQSFDIDTKRTLFEKQGGICPCCFQSLDRADLCEVDHATPLTKGGRDHSSNLLLAHAQCNKEKHNKTLREHWEWRMRVGLDSENLGRKYGLIE